MASAVHRFDPPAASHEAVRAAGGRVVVLALVAQSVATPEGSFPLYWVRNMDNRREAFAFGDELSTGVTHG